jgi:hypothetical protein
MPTEFGSGNVKQLHVLGDTENDIKRRRTETGQAMCL